MADDATGRHAVAADRAAVRFPPPLIFVGALLAGWAIETWLWPLWLSRWISYGWSTSLGAVPFVAGSVLLLAAYGQFRRTGQQPQPWTPTPEIIGGGTYRYSRNPMYLGMALMQLGIGVALLNAWMIALIPVSLWLTYLVAVRQEEAYLERKFGESYRRYKASVRRWL